MKNLYILLCCLCLSGCATSQPKEVVRITNGLKIHFCNRAMMQQIFGNELGITDTYGEIWTWKEDWDTPPTALECQILGEEVYHQWTLKGAWHDK